MVTVALATLADSRKDFYEIRKNLVQEELKSIEWLKDEFRVIESDIIQDENEIRTFAEKVKKSDASCLIIHIPIWADPNLSVKLQNFIELPILLLGNKRFDSSSLVGLLGSGGALDQIGREHFRMFTQDSNEDKKQIRAFVIGANTAKLLKGQTMGLFGGKSLGIFTCVCDPAQWQKTFGIEIEYYDQSEIVERAKQIDEESVQFYKDWLQNHVNSITYGKLFNEGAFDRQIRSYIATKELVQEKKLDFVGVKCQRELSDGYTSQCTAHMLMNSTTDINGKKLPIVHACESDADGALTMQIMKLLSGNKPTALMDLRIYDEKKNVWILANCGAISADFFADDEDSSGFSNIDVVPHAFGKAGGCAYTSVIKEGEVTAARLCRKNGSYWMAIIPGQMVQADQGDLEKVTPEFPKGVFSMDAGKDFLESFGSNHVHITSGNIVEELKFFCAIQNIPYVEWNKLSK